MSELRPCDLRRNLARRRLCGAALLAMPAILTRTARAASRSITFAANGGWFQQAFDTLVLDVFRKNHPEIEVFYYPVGNSFQGLTLLREQRGFPATDVMLLETGVAARTQEEGLLGPEGQRLLVETMFYGPVNAKLDLPAASLARAGALPAMVGRRIEMDWIGITLMRAQITAAWRRYNLGKH
jgi:hypothetical protein